MKTNALLAALVLCGTAIAQPPSGGERPPRPPVEGGPRRERPLFREAEAEFARPRPPALERYMEFLKERNPEEFERLRRLREEDPEAFRQALRERVAEARERIAELRLEPARKPPHRPFAEEVRAIREATNPEAREAAIAALRAKVAATFDQRMEMRRQRIQQIRAELEKLEDQHKADEERRDDIINHHLQRVLEEKPAEQASPPEP